MGDPGRPLLLLEGCLAFRPLSNLDPFYLCLLTLEGFPALLRESFSLGFYILRSIKSVPRGTWELRGWSVSTLCTLQKAPGALPAFCFPTSSQSSSCGMNVLEMPGPSGLETTTVLCRMSPSPADKNSGHVCMYMVGNECLPKMLVFEDALSWPWYFSSESASLRSRSHTWAASLSRDCHSDSGLVRMEV